MKRLLIQTNFTAGQLSPRLWAHTDVNKYKDGLAILQNAKVLPQGPLRKRTGSQYIASVKDSTKEVRLLKFQFSQTNAYILEFGYHYIRFYKGGNSRTAAQITDMGVPYEVATTYTDEEVFNITYTQFANTIYLVHPNHPPAQLVWTSDASWALSDIIFFPPITYESGFSPNVTLTPSAVTGTSINFTASGAVFLKGDVGRQIIAVDEFGNYINGQGRATITAFTSSTVVIADIITDFASTAAIAAGGWSLDLSPYTELTPAGAQLGTTIGIQSLYPDNTGHVQPNTTLTPAAITGSGIVFTSGATAFAAADIGKYIVNLIGPGKGVITAQTATTATVTITENWPNTGLWAATNWEIQRPLDTFRAADIGSYLYLNNGIVQIIAVDAADHATGQVQKALFSLAPSRIWSLEIPAWNSTNGYPSAIAFNQQRLMLASWTAAPQTVVFSASGLFTNMGVGSNDADALQIDIATNKVNQINWALNIRQDMVLGTAGAEISINGSNGPITPSTVQQITRSYQGSSVQTALPLGYEGLYYQRSATKVLSIRYNFLVDTYESEDLTFLAENVTSGLIKELAYADQPDRNIYACCQDGTMAVGTYYKEQQVMGWGQYITDGKFESVQVLSIGQTDEVWVVVNRIINGTHVRMIERFDDADGTHNIDLFSDSALFLSIPLAISAISIANPGVITSAAHGLSNGDMLKIFDATFTDTSGTDSTPLDGHAYTVANVTTDTFTLVNSSGTAVSTASFHTYSGTETECFKLVTSVSGLDHLEGKIVQVKADGALATSKVVASGSIALDAAAYEITVGLPYTMIVKTLTQEYNLGIGSQQGQQTRPVRPILRVYQSYFPTMNGNYKPSRQTTDLMDSKVPLFTGDVVYGGLTWSNGAQLTITDANPFPVQISGIFGSFDGGTM